ncbi:enolase C-terminal domain-like protein [Deinococcus soli (ex Cha et al. 2016)]|uniref:L-alanine-DL-glutamate epimerase-like enolase superfamily enzyme n=2 Tax=Deinococcus soli (ex Cha et al. 2016) TaxID=1309411 RepID=A0ACC6KBV4_9DEIO|nr:enolase C-terminal domain-like protein [Deinococcus soli (ex Cha et al. 2016)]MDR6216844.1 L-alanine-DL-glutamate epimerase-like enolase superfamily enzyme [Deinococcus soli (ex Cha et al. 2016)]MDR6327665.1 L-alanine-DL-glutamate epimerase-like enolase superfamily enzyme [Deinococcus soli (ex Cha et al. 2016)]MDR6749940.1 L-alanine-DL-glutamate epimerase-like enolase superfamily enzyme [Deinococcus soli (ex Cha et al. 2016)]
MSAPTVARVEGIPFRLPLTSALAWGAHSALSAAEHVLVRVTLSDGTVGQAEATPRPTIYGETTASVLGILAHLEAGLRGLAITDEVSLNRVWNSVVNNHTARGALDMALHDARARAQGVTLFDTLLGPNTRVRPSFILGIAPPEEMLAEARRVVASGVRCLKVKVGREHERDLRVIRELRAEFGGDVLLYADSNETLTPQSAPAALDAMREAGLMYVEEPLPARNLRARAELHAQGRLPVVADDSCFTPADLERELDFDTFDVLNVKTARNGFTDGLQMLRRAAAAGKRGMVGSQASTGLGTVHAALLSTQAEVTEPCELSFVLKLQDDLLDGPVVFRDGWLDVPSMRERCVDEAKLSRYRLA